MHIQNAVSAEEVRRCYPVMAQLRPHHTESSFCVQVHRQMQHAGYALAYLEDEGVVRAVAGYRISECLFNGHYLYVDDLVTEETSRSRGYGDALFDWLVTKAREAGCGTLELDSGVQRHEAHRFYLRKRMNITSHHFSLALE